MVPVLGRVWKGRALKEGLPRGAGWAPRRGGEHLGAEPGRAVLDCIPQAPAQARLFREDAPRWGVDPQPVLLWVCPTIGDGSQAIPGNTEFSNPNFGVMNELTFSVLGNLSEIPEMFRPSSLDAHPAWCGLKYL